MRLSAVFASLALSTLSACEAKAAPSGPVASSLHELEFKAIDGTPRKLSDYKGKVVLAVNVASKCGYTRQYDGLQKLYEAYEKKGFVVLGFPSNDFMGQEPGTDGEIATFCKGRFGVKFPMFSKAPVKGSDASPVFRFLSATAGEPSWNFNKYLVGKDGKVIKRFDSGVEPDAKELSDAIDAALAKAG